MKLLIPQQQKITLRNTGKKSILINNCLSSSPEIQVFPKMREFDISPLKYAKVPVELKPGKSYEMTIVVVPETV